MAPRQGGGYTIGYVEHLPEHEGTPTPTAKLPLLTMTTDRLVLAAGTLGSPYLLLRNRSAFPGIGSALGTRFCGNGDLLSFVLRARIPGPRRVPRVLDASRGTVITSTVRVPDATDEGGTGPGYYIQDAGFPGFVDWMLEASDVPGTFNRMTRFALRRVWARLSGNPRSDLGGELAALLGKAELSSSSLPLLGMGRDVPDGNMRLRGKYLDIDWTVKTSKNYFDRVERTMADIAKELGGRFRENPLSWLKRVITVHPLGGCPMGHSDGEGVVDEWGQVFNHPNLFVADGSVMPGPVGPNPSLTIAAFADRMAQHMLETAPRPARAAT